MSQAEIFRIIDIDGVAEPISENSNGNGSSTEACEAIVKCGENIALALHRRKPTVAVDHTELPKVPDSRLVMINAPLSPQARSYRALRHRLLAFPSVRVVSVTSARPGEGKTTSAANLALSLAEDTMVRVLLVDANLRRPALGRLFGISPSQTLVDQITRSVELRPPYPVSSVAGTLVHVAALPQKPPARLERSLFNAALYELSTAYDYVVIDTASVLESADTDIVGECADAAIMVLRAGVSRKTDLRRAVAQLAPAAVLGTVLLDA
jgi:Mrp family chromosome partitioning ATPase